MELAAVVVSILSLVVSGSISAAALVFAHRADRRATRAEAAAARTEERELASIRAASLERMSIFVHEIAHAYWDALSGDASALGRIDRHRARLRATLDASDVKLSNCEVVASREVGTLGASISRMPFVPRRRYAQRADASASRGLPEAALSRF